MGGIKFLLPFLLVSNVFALMPPPFSCSLDPDCLFDMPLNEGWGTRANDYSRNGLTGTLNGGPAIVDGQGSFTGWGTETFSIIPTTFTHTPMLGHYIYFIGNTGEDITTAVTSLFEFSSNKPFMFIMTLKFALITLSDSNDASIMNWSQGANLCGFTMEAEHTDPQREKLLIFFPPSIVLYWPFDVEDTRPHQYGLWRDSAGNIDLFFDGKRVSQNSGIGDFTSCAGGSAMNFAKAKGGASQEWSGGLGGIRFWNNVVPRSQAPGFFLACYKYYHGGGN